MPDSRLRKKEWNSNALTRQAVGRVSLTSSRQRKLKCGAISRIWYGPQPPAMYLDYRSADRQPQPHPLRLRRIEGVEDPFCLLWLNTDANVSDRNQRASRLISARLDQELSGPILDWAHGLYPIDEQIQDDLL
jgi:hypothetical protein